MNTNFRKTSKKLYDEAVDEYFLSNKGIQYCPPFDSTGLLTLINIVKESKLAVNRGEFLCKNLMRLMRKYDVISIAGTYKLIKTRKSLMDPIQFYVTCKDAFKLIEAAHLQTGHGGLKAIMEYLTPKYCISEMAVKLYLSMCTMRDKKNDRSLIRNKKQFFHNTCKVGICILNRTSGLFGYILLVVDTATNYVNLQPLASHDDLSVAIEMLKISADFGLPSVIETSATEFFRSVVLHMKKMFPGYNPSVMYEPVDFDELIIRIEKYLDDWQDSTCSNDWTFGVHAAQWRLNNSEDFTKTTNFEKVFQRKPFCQFIAPNYSPGLVFLEKNEFVSYEYVEIQCIDGKMLDESVISPVPTSSERDSNEIVASNAEDLEDSIKTSVIAKFSASVISRDLTESNRVGNEMVTVNSFNLDSIANSNLKLISKPIEVRNVIEKELLQEELDKTIKFFRDTDANRMHRKTYLPEAVKKTSSKQNSIEQDSFENLYTTSIDLKNESNFNEHNSAIDDVEMILQDPNAGKITLVSVKYEEDSDCE